MELLNTPTAPLQRGKISPETRPNDDCVWQPVILGGQDPRATEVVIWLATLHFGPYWARRPVEEARYDQAAKHVKPTWLSRPSLLNCSCEKKSTQPYFILKVHENGGWGSIVMRKQVFECPGYNTELCLMMRLQYWSLANREYHFITITLRSTMLGCHQWVK